MTLGFGPSSASYLIAGKSRAKHRKSVQYIVTDWIKHVSVACWHPPFSACAGLKRSELCPRVAPGADSQQWVGIYISTRATEKVAVKPSCGD